MNLKEQIEGLLEEKFDGTDYFLVEVKVSPSKVIVFVDSSAKGGIKLDECIEVTKYLQSKLESENVLETHELEVSSPGMDQPLKVIKQYKKRIGQEVTVLLKDGIRKEGVLKSVDETGITIEEITDKKSGQVMVVTIPFIEIKETKIIFSFDKILN